MITHVVSFRNGKFCNSICIKEFNRKIKIEKIRSFVKEVEQAAKANPNNTYYVELKTLTNGQTNIMRRS